MKMQELTITVETSSRLGCGMRNLDVEPLRVCRALALKCVKFSHATPILDGENQRATPTSILIIPLKKKRCTSCH